MNYNSKINWRPGMEITSHAMRLMDDVADFKNHFALKLAMGPRTRGIIPETELSCNPAFVGRTVEIIGMKLTAMLPSGEIICIDDDITVPIDKAKIESLTNDTALVHKVYLVVTSSEETLQYDVEDVPFIRPKYKFEFCSEEEVEEKDCMPLTRMLVEAGSLSIDEHFIMPAIMSENIPEFKEFHTYLQDNAREMSEHPNLESSDLRLTLLQASHQGNIYTGKIQTMRFINVVFAIMSWLVIYTEEYARSHKLSGERPELPELLLPTSVNLYEFIQNIKDINDAIAKTLDVCIVEDHSIDFNALKAQLKTEILDEIHPDVDAKIAAARTEIHDELLDELDQRIHDIIDRQMEELRDKLRGQLYEDLYHPLYDSLYNALKDIVGTRPVEVLEDNFMPLI